MLVTTIITKIFSVYFYLYMFLIILSNYMAIAESFLKVPIFRGTLVSILFLFTIYWFDHTITILSKSSITYFIYPWR